MSASKETACHSLALVETTVQFMYAARRLFDKLDPALPQA